MFKILTFKLNKVCVSDPVTVMKLKYDKNISKTVIWNIKLFIFLHIYIIFFQYFKSCKIKINPNTTFAIKEIYNYE